MFRAVTFYLEPGGDVAKYIDKIWGANTSSYLYEAINFFAKNNENNDYDMELINTDGKNAADMTKALKVIGDGDMQQGFRTFANYYENIGRQAGEQNGFIKGSATTLGITLLIGGGVYLWNHYKTKKELEKEGKKIYNALKESSVDGETADS